MIERRFVRGVLFCLVIVLPVRLQATTVLPRSFAELCREAERVFVGTVVEVRSRWRDRERMEIGTAVVFSDVVPIHGTGGGEITLRFAGGELDGIREEIVGLPRFTPGERVVIFARGGTTISPLVGFHQGCFAVVEGPSGSVVQSADGRAVIGVDDGRLQLAEPEQGLEGAISLPQFIDVIERLIAPSR